MGLPQREGVPGDTRSAASLLSATKGRHYYVSQHQTDTTTHQSEEYARAAPLSAVKIKHFLVRSEAVSAALSLSSLEATDTILRS